jgi:membrane dipeptidase
VAYLNFSRNEWKFASLVDYLDPVDYAVRLIGIDHVGLASDFNHGGGVTGFANVRTSSKCYEKTAAERLFGAGY